MKLQNEGSKLWSFCEKIRLQKIMLPKPFREFIELLEKNQVKYLVVGWYASAIHFS